MTSPDDKGRSLPPNVAEAILDAAGDPRWSDSDKLAVALEYISRFADPGNWASYLEYVSHTDEMWGDGKEADDGDGVHGED